jgi:hypothetical protein
MFLSISLPLSRNLSPSLSYHIHRGTHSRGRSRPFSHRIKDINSYATKENSSRCLISSETSCLARNQASRRILFRIVGINTFTPTRKRPTPATGVSTPMNIVRKRITKVTDFLSFCPFGISIFPFLTIGSSMCQKRILPYIIIPSTFSPQAYSLLERYRQTEKFQHPLLPKFFFLSTECAGPYPQAQLYWAGRTMGWMAD